MIAARKLTQAEFLNRAKAVHKGKYDYSKAICNPRLKYVLLAGPFTGNRRIEV